MISVADLLANGHLPSNYFASDVYVRGTLELGLLENRRGDRLLALPSALLKAIYSGLDHETGQATWLVLKNCGLWWGKNFYARFCEELSDYYKKPIADFSMAEFLQALQECWRTHGWGQIELDSEYHRQGFLVVSIVGSPFTAEVAEAKQPSGALEAGVLQSFFSQLTGRDLVCVQTTCESLGADANRFVLGLASRLNTATALVQEGQSHEAIMQILAR